MRDYIKSRIGRLKEAFPDHEQISSLIEATRIIKKAFDANRKLLVCGNGGSAADAQHIAAEFVVKYKKERRPYPAIALSVDTSILTACSNDFGFEHVFERQVDAIGQKEDVLLAISTSGKSENVNRAVKKAKEKGLYVLYMTGESKPVVESLCDVILKVHSDDTPIIQEIHRLYGHLLVELLEYMEKEQ